MTFFQLKPVQAVTFDEFIQAGLNQDGANIVDGVPWAFMIFGCPVTHEFGKQYRISGYEGTFYFEPGKVLVSASDGILTMFEDTVFDALYQKYESA